MQVNVIRALVSNLKEEIPKDTWEYMDRELAYRYLKHFTEEDFGYDASAWELWFKRGKDAIRNTSPLPKESNSEDEI